MLRRLPASVGLHKIAQKISLIYNIIIMWLFATNAFSSPQHWLYHRLFFNIFEKTQARKNSTVQKTQGFFRPKLNEPVVIVAK